MTVPFSAFIYVPFISAAFPHPCIRSVGGRRSLLGRAVEWFTNSFAGALYVVHHVSDRAVRELRLDRLGCEPIAVHETNPLDALISAGTLLDAKTILLLHFGCLYAPPSLVLHACSHHLRCR